MASHVVTLPSSVLAPIHGAVAVKYMNFACYTLLVYDYLLTMSDEIRLIWPWEWRIGKVLYLLTRYLIYAEAVVYSTFWFDRSLSIKGCKTLFDAGGWLGVTGVIIAQWIICIRTAALWEKKPIVVAYLIFMCLGSEVAALILMHNFLGNLKWALSPFPSISRCFVSLESNKLFIDYALVLSVEISVIILTIWKGITHWKIRGSRLMSVLYRDGIIFFVGLFLMSCANAVMYISSEKALVGVVLSEFQRVLHAVLTSRIILHLRAASADSKIGGGYGAAPSSHSESSGVPMDTNTTGLRFRETKWDAETGGFSISID